MYTAKRTQSSASTAHHLVSVEAGYRGAMQTNKTPAISVRENVENQVRVTVQGAAKEVQANGVPGMTAPYQKGSRRIHILGAGNVGKFAAHALAGIADRPPITILLHRALSIQQWYDEGQSINIIRDGRSDVEIGFDIEYTGMTQSPISGEPMSQFDRNFGFAKDQKQWFIEKLIVSTKAPFTVAALSSIKDRLGPSSTICFLQNGMGLVEEINLKVFTNPATRPRYVIGTVSHGLAGHQRKFTACQNGMGEIALSLVPTKIASPNHGQDSDSEAPLVTRMTYGWTASSRSLVKTLVRTPRLAVTGLQYADMVQRQLEKLAVNSVINPLSVLLDCTNGQLLHNFAVTRLMREILTEVLSVIRSLPELAMMKDRDTRFSIMKLEGVVVQIAKQTEANISSMLQDVRNGKKTEIDYINGYILKRAEELGIACPTNMAMVQMIKAKSMINQRERGQYIPFV